MPFGDRRNPFDEIQDLMDRMNREFESMWRGREGGGMPDFGGLESSTSIDVADHGDEFVVTADLPGFDKEEIDITIADSTLRIAAESESGIDEEEQNYIRRERHQESVTRTVRLPEPVDDENVSATYRNGVLTIRLPKQAGDRGTRIDIE